MAAMGEVISIDNFRSRMSPFELTKNTLYALVDMGSNGIRFSISDLSSPRSRLLHCIYRERAGISLYDALHESATDSKPFHFPPRTIEQVAETLARFKRICDRYGVPIENIQVFATEAMRTAKNRDDMLKAIKRTSSLTVDILSPGMESLFGAMGARSGFDQVDGLFMDLGGGSVQMTYISSSAEEGYDILAAEAAKSMPYGAAKLTAALKLPGTADSTKTDLKTIMNETFEGMKRKFPKLLQDLEGDGVTIYFCGGGFRGYGSMLMHTDPIQPYPIPAIGGYTVPGSRFVQWEEMMSANAYEGKIYGMSKRRREQFPAIATVVQALIEAVPNIKQVVFCSGGNREGVLYMKLPPDVRETHPGPLLPGGQSSERGIVHAIVDKIMSALPTDSHPSVFSPNLLHYIARNIWIDMGDPADANSAKALHNPISGPLAGLPGLDHQLRAILALTMCARWGTDIGSVDKILFNNLRLLIGPELSWWCEYIGTTAGLLGTVIPVFPNSAGDLDIISLHSSTSSGLGKKGHKVGIRVQIQLAKQDVDGLASMFNNVGKNLPLNWKVEAEVDELI